MKLNRLSSLTIASFLALIFAAALLWLSANVAASTAGPILFSDDFEGGAANWTAVEGTWSVVLDGSHVYQQDDVSVTGRSAAGAPESDRLRGTGAHQTGEWQIRYAHGALSGSEQLLFVRPAYR